MKRIIWVMVICLIGLTYILPARALADENSWSRLALEKVLVGPVIADPARSDNLYASTSMGLQKSTDGGRTWTIISKGLPNTQADTLVINPVNSRMLYIGYDGQGIFRSTDGGITWIPKNDGLVSLSVRSLAFHPKDPNTLYAGLKGGVCITNNRGDRWSPTSGFKKLSNVNAIAINPLDPTVIYAGTGSEGVYKSTNGGVSWKDINNGLPNMSILSLSIDPVNPDQVIAGTYNAVTPTDLYVGGVYGGVFYTKDGGATWQASKSLTSVTVFGISRLTQKTDVVYATTLGGIYRSIDGGFNWTDINAGLSNEFLHYLLVLPRQNQVELLSSTPNGIFIYTDTEWDTLKAHLLTAPKWVWYSGGGIIGVLLVGFALWFGLKSRKKSKNKYAW